MKLNIHYECIHCAGQFPESDYNFEMESCKDCLKIKKDSDLIIRVVHGCGYLPILTIDGKEVYRGEFRKTPEQALHAVENMFNNMLETNKRYRED